MLEQWGDLMSLDIHSEPQNTTHVEIHRVQQQQRLKNTEESANVPRKFTVGWSLSSQNHHLIPVFKLSE